MKQKLTQKEQVNIPDKHKFTMNELGVVLGVSSATLTQWLKTDLNAPVTRVGNRCYFDLSVIIPYYIASRYTPNHQLKKLEKQATPTSELEYRQQLAKTITMEAKANATLNEYVPAHLLQTTLSDIFKTFSNDLSRMPARLKAQATTEETKSFLKLVDIECNDLQQQLYDNFNNMDLTSDIDEVFEEVEEKWYGKK